MKKIYTISVVIILSVFAISAQNKIKGTLTDSQTKASVSFASVVLFSLPDSLSYKGMITGNDGSFVFENLKKGSYFYKVKFMGYRDVQSDKIELDGTEGIFEAGSVSMEEETKTLKEVDVVGERLKGVETVDHTVYTIPESASKSAGNGTDILKRIPSVQVDLSNNISLQGSSNIIITVDGKERDNNFIAQIDPKTIDKVEVSTNPSSKYDASVTGVINIVLKRQKRLGVNGNFDLEIPTNTDHYISSPSFGIDYGYYKFRFFTSANAHAEGFKVYKDFLRESGENTFTANGTGRFLFHTITFHYGVDYFINDKNTFNFYANYNPSQFNMDYMFDKYISSQEQPAKYYTTDTKAHDHREGQFYSLFYKRGFAKTGHEITADVSSYINHTYTNNTYIDQYYQSDLITAEGDALYREERIRPSRRSLNTKLDYKLPVSDMFMLEAGYQNYSQWMDNRFLSAGSSESRFQFRELRNAGYIQFGVKVKNWNLRVGTRAENSEIRINNVNSAGYSCILPNTSVQYTIDKTQNIKLAYRKSIRRPGSDDLNPFAVNYDSMNISKGNPNLQPSYSDKLQLNYSKNIGSSFIGPEVFFIRNTDVFQRYMKVNSNNVLEINIDNLGSGYEYGCGFSGNIQATKWLLLNPYARVYQQHVDGLTKESVLEIPAQDNFAWQASMYINVKLPKGFALWSYATYNSPTVAFQSTNYRSPLYLFGLEKTILKEKGKLGINWYEPFKEYFRFNRQETQSSLLYQDDDNHVRLYTLVSLKFTYRFAYGKEVKKLDRQKSLENDGKGGLN